MKICFYQCLHLTERIIEKNAYPPIEDQLDMIYHEGVDAWKLKIKEVKDKYPKV
jgi:hypothetical protein